MEKTGDIYLISEKGRCVAYWHPVDGSRDVFLCAMNLPACSNTARQLDLALETDRDDGFRRLQ
jgi:hypothetical protein